MAVYPYVELKQFGINTNTYKFELVNNGIGPAIISSIRIKDKEGKSYDRIQNYVNSKLSPQDSVKFYFADISVGRLIPEKESVELIVNYGKRTKSAFILADMMSSKEISIKIGYKSIYGEEWIIPFMFWYAV